MQRILQAVPRNSVAEEDWIVGSHVLSVAVTLTLKTEKHATRFPSSSFGILPSHCVALFAYLRRQWNKLKKKLNPSGITLLKLRRRTCPCQMHMMQSWGQSCGSLDKRVARGCGRLWLSAWRNKLQKRRTLLSFHYLLLILKSVKPKQSELRHQHSSLARDCRKKLLCVSSGLFVQNNCTLVEIQRASFLMLVDAWRIHNLHWTNSSNLTNLQPFSRRSLRQDKQRHAAALCLQRWWRTIRSRHESLELSICNSLQFICVDFLPLKVASTNLIGKPSRA